MHDGSMSNENLSPQNPVPYVPTPPAPLSDSDARMWAMFANLSGLIFAIFGPLIILLVFGDRNAFVKSQSTEALNFQITYFISVLVSSLLMLVIIGFILLPIVIIVGVVFMIIASVKSYNGEDYRYPINIRMVK